MRKGFTLVELIVVIAIITVIAATVFVAVDPAKQLHKARNSSRWSDVTTILEGVKKYQFENDGVLPPIDTDPNTVQVIGANVARCTGTCAGLSLPTSDCGIDLSAPLRPYMKEIPMDPTTGTENSTRYYIDQDQYGLITVGACDPEGEGAGGAGEIPDIQLTR